MGSYVAESLCRSGVGHLLLIDADKVAASNINRQLPALTSTFGRFKTEVVRQRLLDINPDCEIETVSKFYEPGAFAEFFSGSFTLSPMRSIQRRQRSIFIECVQRDIPVISSDNYQGGRIATEKLISADCQYIVHTNGPIELQTPAQKRRIGYEDTMIEHGLTPITYHLDFNISQEEKGSVYVTFL